MRAQFEKDKHMGQVKLNNSCRRDCFIATNSAQQLFPCIAWGSQVNTGLLHTGSRQQKQAARPRR